MSAEWYYKVMDEAVGPLSPSELRRHADEGKITPDMLVRRGEDDRWVSADKVKGLFKGPMAAGASSAEAQAPLSWTQAPGPGRNLEARPTPFPRRELPSRSQSLQKNKSSSIPVTWVASGAIALVLVFVIILVLGRGSGSSNSNASHQGSSKLTAANFFKISAGMSRQELTLLLGEPTEVKKEPGLSLEIWKWREGAKEIEVVLVESEWGLKVTTLDGATTAKLQKGLE